jgi:hypothetical protein
VKNKTSPNKTSPFSNYEIGLEMLEIGLKMSGAGSEVFLQGLLTGC